MLTRSASRKQAESRVVSVKKPGGTNILQSNLLDSNKVMNQGHDVEVGDGERVTVHKVQLNLNVVTPKSDSRKNHSCVFNVSEMVIHLPQTDSKEVEGKFSLEGDISCNCSSTPSAIKVRSKSMGKNSTEMNLSPNHNCCGNVTIMSTSPAKVDEDSNEKQSAISTVRKKLCFNKSLELSHRKMRRGKSMIDKESDTDNGSSYLKRMILKNGYNIEDFEKKPFVQLVRLTELEIREWRRPEDPNRVVNLPDKIYSSPSSSDCSNCSNDPLARKARLLEELKMVQKSYTESCKDHEKTTISRHDRGKNHLSSEDGKSRNDSSPRRLDGNSLDRAIPNMEFDNVGEKRAILSETDEGFNEEVTGHLNCQDDDQDSIVTDIFEGEIQKETQQNCQITIQSIHDIVGEIIERLSSPTPDAECSYSEIVEPEISKCKDAVEAGMSQGEEGEEISTAAKRRSTSKSNRLYYYEVYTDSEDESDRREIHQESKLKVKRKKSNDSIDYLITNPALSGSGGKNDGKSEESEGEFEAKYTNGWEITESELLQIQLDCIKKELSRRHGESATASGKKKSKPLGKSEGEENSLEDAKDFESARKTRRSKKVEEVAEETPKSHVKRTPSRRSTPRKLAVETMDEEREITETPKSTKTKLLRKPESEVKKERRKSRLEEISETPKRSGIILKMTSHTEEDKSDHTDEKGKELSSFKSKSLKETPKKQEKPRRDESVDEEPVSSTPKKAKSPKKTPEKEKKREREIPVDEEPMSSTPKKAKSPKKSSQMEVIEEKVKEPEDNEVELVSTPKSRKSKSPMESRESEALSTPKSRKSKSPMKPQLEESKEATFEAVSSPLKKKKEAAQRLRAVEEVDGKTSSPKKSPGREQIEEKKPEESKIVCVKSTPKTTETESKSPKKREIEVVLTEESESNEVEMPSPKGEKTLTPNKPIIHLDESDGSELEEYMCTVSSRKQKKSRSVRKADVDVFLTDSSDSDDVEASRSSEKNKPNVENESEVTDMLAMLSPKRQKSQSPQKTKVSDDVVASPKKKKLELNAEEEDEEEGEMESEDAILFSRSKHSQKERKRKTQPDVNGEMIAPKLPDEILASISSKKSSVKVKGQEFETNSSEESITEKKKKKKEETEKSLKIVDEREDYIPLNVAGSTKFAVVGLDKLQSSTPRHPAFDLKRDLLYGSRVKRIPYSQMQSYKMKEESRKMRF